MNSILTAELRRRLELMSFFSRRKVLGSRQGMHRSQRRGFGNEFSDYRQYTLGDTPRNIDWGLYARTDRLYVKQFHEEQELCVLIILDLSGSIMIDTKPSKADFATTLALSLTYIALKNQDKVKIHILGTGNTSPTLSGANAVSHATQFLKSLKTNSGQYDQVKALKDASQFAKIPGVAVLVSDFMFDLDRLEAGLHAIISRNVLLTLFNVFTSQDKNPFPETDYLKVRDVETNQELELNLGVEEKRRYQEIFSNHLKSVRALAQAVQSEYQEVQLKDSVTDSIIESLSRSSFIR